ncbi:hypothetical protein [Nocardioides antri]|uniref:Uncharacterized protein n=1 Tax=Nocardioides antri TaxID=2607659 RepID=A0A5B1M7S8_9ACTN|nr:hypothetical protein [Nocardioides antri]KAA1428774.1 hypothetical protein F0U47_00700 [Nocardioides antri]
MVSSAASRRNERAEQAAQVFGEEADAALDALELLDLAWHDCYGESTPPQQVVEDVWVVADANLARFVSAARLAVTDFRDLRLSADALRQGS